MERICVLAKDVARITGYSERYGQQVLQELKLRLHKKKHQFITKQELADYLGIEVTLIKLR